MAAQSVALITGCSSGIGAALAEEFHERGLMMYATARRTESLAALPARDFARQVVTAVLAGAAPVVVRGGPHSFRLPFLQRWAPTRMLDRKLSRMFGLDQLRRNASDR